MNDSFDLDFGTALAAASALQSRQISSRELTEHTFARIDAFQPKLNAYVYQLREDALRAAARADEALVHEEDLALFHGVPFSVKESFGVKGQPCTWGLPPFKDSRAPADAVAVRRLREAGGVLLGATNVPLNLADAQAFNEIYGTTNNPWDLSRTPGGSSGGSAASLAAGMAFLSIGSDIGGSIRCPAAFCGVYGHKPTLVNQSGHRVGGLHNAPGFSTLLAVAGPMARSAEDLEAALTVLGGPEAPDSKAVRWSLPPARHEHLADYRIGYVLEDPAVPLSAETRTVLEDVISACQAAGCRMQKGWPEGIRLTDLLETYFFLLGAFNFSMLPPADQESERQSLMARKDPRARGSLSSFAEWQAENLKRLAYRAIWERYFASVDVLLLPAMFTSAFPHDPTPTESRTVITPEGDERPFRDLLAYIAPATLTGCPATVAPTGLSQSGLPVGLQIMGPYLEDATPIRFASLLAREIGGFHAPEGYRGIG
jgi:amidase